MNELRAFLRKLLLIRFLEFLKGAHQLGMRHHRVGRNARLGLKPGLKFIVSINIHMVLLGYGQVFAVRGRGQRAAHRGAAELLK